MNTLPLRTILYGDTLVLAGVRTNLSSNRDLEVIMLNHPLDESLDDLCALNPAVIIFDQNAIQPDFPLAILQHPGLLLIGINPENHQALVWSGRQVPADVAADLMKILESRRE